MLQLLAIAVQRGVVRLTGDDTDCMGDNEYFDFGDSDRMICADTCKTGFFKRETNAG